MRPPHTPDEWQASRPRRAAYGHMDIASDGTVGGARGWLASVARTDGGRACRGATPVVWDADGRCRAAAGGERLPRGDVRWGVFRGGPRDADIARRPRESAFQDLGVNCQTR